MQVEILRFERNPWCESSPQQLKKKKTPNHSNRNMKTTLGTAAGPGSAGRDAKRQSAGLRDRRSTKPYLLIRSDYVLTSMY